MIERKNEGRNERKNCLRGFLNGNQKKSIFWAESNEKIVRRETNGRRRGEKKKKIRTKREGKGYAQQWGKEKSKDW